MESSDSMELFLSENRFPFLRAALLPRPARRYGANKPFDRMAEKRPRDGKRNTANGTRFFMAVLPFFRFFAFSKKRSWEMLFSMIRRIRDAFCNIL